MSLKFFAPVDWALDIVGLGPNSGVAADDQADQPSFEIPQANSTLVDSALEYVDPTTATYLGAGAVALTALYIAKKVWGNHGTEIINEGEKGLVRIADAIDTALAKVDKSADNKAALLAEVAKAAINALSKEAVKNIELLPEVLKEKVNAKNVERFLEEVLRICGLKPALLSTLGKNLDAARKSKTARGPQVETQETINTFLKSIAQLPACNEEFRIEKINGSLRHER